MKARLRVFGGFAVLGVVSASICAVGVAGEPPEYPEWSARQVPPESMLPNFIDTDPARELSEKVPLSDAQARFVSECYARYRTAALALGREVQDRLDDEGQYGERRRLGADAPAAVVIAAAKSLDRAKRSIRARYLVEETRFLDRLSEAIAVEQQPSFRRIALAILRRSWLDPGPMVPQDFFQFPDPIEILLRERPCLGGNPESLEAFDDYVALSEAELSAQIPSLWMACWDDGPRAYMIARAGGEPDRIRAAFRKNVNAWTRLYDRLEQVVKNGCVVFDDAGQREASQRVELAFWQGCFPELIGGDVEITASMFDAINEVRDHLDAQTLETIDVMKRDYLERRHRLLRSAVEAHVRDYQVLGEAEGRTERLYLAPWGASSVEVTRLQLARCRLSLDTRVQIEDALGGAIDLLGETQGCSGALAAVRESGAVVFDTPATLDSLNAVLERLTESDSEPGEAR